jgi:hypothetical protein
MTTMSTPYNAKSLDELKSRKEYEAWFLEAVYEIVDQPFAVEGGDGLIYPPAGGHPTYTLYGVANIIIGDWRPGFLKAGAPLVFVITFKLLDMLLEWVLTQNGKPPTYKFVQKIADMKGPVLFPLLIETRPWLRERLIALYEQLEPLRGTIIHDRHFKTSDGTLQVSSSKGGTIGPIFTITSKDIRNLALIFVSMLRYLEDVWTLDHFQEKRIRHALDELTYLHGLSSLGQLPPGFISVRVYVADEDPIHFDIERIRCDVAKHRQGQDVIFNIRIIAVARDGSRAVAYLIPWDQLQDPSPQFQKTRAELATYLISLPADIDPAAAARDMKLIP